jgi:hypothetical protein
MRRDPADRTLTADHGRDDVLDEACVSVEERSGRLQSRVVVELAKGARVEASGTFFAVVVRKAPTDQLRSLLLFTVGIALFATVGGLIFLCTAVFAALGWTIDQVRRVEERVILRVDEIGRVSVSPLPA